MRLKFNFKPDFRSEIPVYEQIKNYIVERVSNGEMKGGTPLPSINKLRQTHNIAAGTVYRAYEELRLQGILVSHQGKGYYIAENELMLKPKVFLLFDRMNAYKEILYESFLEGLEHQADVSVFFHHYDFHRFEQLIRDNKGRYTHFVVMPHLHENPTKVLKLLPPERLILIDANVEGILNVSGVYQDFETDIYAGLKSGVDWISRYKKIWLSLSSSRFQFVPEGCIAGFKRFCTDSGLDGSVVPNLAEESLKQNELYIVFSDAELIMALKYMRQAQLKPGKDIGIISYDDTPMKEILEGGIAALSTDFRQMGLTAAGMVLGTQEGLVHNPFSLIVRASMMRK